MADRGTVKLGDEAKDIVTGLKGIVTATMDSITGCRNICIKPQEIKDGKPIDATWVDEPCVEVLRVGALKLAGSGTSNDGGPMQQSPPRTM